MRAAVIILIVLAVAAAGGVAFFANRIMAPGQVAAPPVVMAVATGPEVLVVQSDIGAGETIGRNGMGWQPWPEHAVRADVVAVRPGDGVDLEAARQAAMKTFEGMTARRDLMAGEPLTKVKVFKRDGAAFMPGAVAPGMRAISVPVSPESGAGGFILPGDFVDVIVAHDLSKSLPRDMADVAPRAGIARMAAETVVSDVRVLAVDQTINQEPGEGVAVVGKTVTLEVTPEQAAALSLATQMGEVNLSLRPLGDRDQPGEAQNITVTDMGLSPSLASAISLGLGGRGGVAAVSPSGAASEPAWGWTVRVNRGGRVERVQGN